MSTADTAPEISAVIPAKNEAANLAELVDEIRQALQGRSYEIVIVDDGSDDDTPQLLAELAAADARILHLRHPRSLGRSAAVYTGSRKAGGRHIVTLDGDGQNDPVYIPILADRLADPAIGLVAGQRLGRKDTAAKRLASRIANAVRRALLGDGTRDTGCGLKAYRREAFLALPYFETMHRFLPALFMADGWQVDLVDVVDRPRRHGTSKYGNLDRLLVGIPDLFGVAWLARRRRKTARLILPRDESGEPR
jgi:glycosyltransferase involved in cell wall biosynthesis